MKIRETVNKYLRKGHDHVIGYADLRNLLTGKYTQYGYGIVFGRRLDDSVIDSIETGPNVDYYNLYQAVNVELAEIARSVAAELCDNGVEAVSIAPTLTASDRNEHFDRTLSLDFSHKMVATRAGLGWIGKSGLLITYDYGPRVRLVSVLLDYPVDCCREPVLKSECQDCDLCVQNCPANALSGKEWDITTRREEFFDAFACREKCRELGDYIGKGIRLCGICVSVCPVGKR
ncbi:MAG: epoxyqueuosine reductase [candidate division WOR-3 bacterium]|nr:epoxyqueuosine reductase [candidate division WOR-3 bacterium]